MAASESRDGGNEDLGNILLGNETSATAADTASNADDTHSMGSLRDLAYMINSRGRGMAGLPGVGGMPPRLPSRFPYVDASVDFLNGPHDATSGVAVGVMTSRGRSRSLVSTSDSSGVIPSRQISGQISPALIPLEEDIEYPLAGPDLVSEDEASSRQLSPGRLAPRKDSDMILTAEVPEAAQSSMAAVSPSRLAYEMTPAAMLQQPSEVSGLSVGNRAWHEVEALPIRDPMTGQLVGQWVMTY